MEQLGSNRTYFHEIFVLIIFSKTLQKSQFSLKSDKNKGYLLNYLLHGAESFLRS